MESCTIYRKAQKISSYSSSYYIIHTCSPTMFLRALPSLTRTPALTLYQYAICPYCCKVKSVLDYYRIPYTTVEVNPLTKSELLQSPDFRQRKVPFAVFNDRSTTTQGESSIIIQTLIDRKLVPDDGGFSVSKLPLLNRMSILMFPNITRKFAASWQAFGYVDRVVSFSRFQKIYNHVLGAVAMVFANGRLKLKYGISDERKELVDNARSFMSELKSLSTGAVGEEPSLFEIQMFGTVRAIEGLDTHDWLLNEGCVEFGTWYRGIKAKVDAKTLGDAQ